LLAVLEEENAILRQQQFVSHAAFTDRKNQALRELMAVQRQVNIQSAAQRMQPLLERLSEELKENARLLKLHISSVGEISDIIVGSLRQADSDGTYSRAVSARGWQF
jgi:hypothetical protein